MSLTCVEGYIIAEVRRKFPMSFGHFRSGGGHISDELFGCPLMFGSRDQGRGVGRYDVTVDSGIWRKEKNIRS